MGTEVREVFHPSDHVKVLFSTVPVILIDIIDSDHHCRMSGSSKSTFLVGVITLRQKKRLAGASTPTLHR